MALSTRDARTVLAVQTVADHWGITGFLVRTPQDGSPKRLEVYAEAWSGAPDASRTHVQPLAMSEYIGDAAILTLLDQVGQAYEAYRGAGLDRGPAQYAAMRDVLQKLKQTEGVFPADAT